MTNQDSDYCSSCEGGYLKTPLDGDTPRGMLCCEVCYQCEVCGCSCTDEQQEAEDKLKREPVSD